MSNGIANKARQKSATFALKQIKNPRYTPAKRDRKQPVFLLILFSETPPKQDITLKNVIGTNVL